MDANRMNASALWLRFSESFGSRGQRLNQPMVRSTIDASADDEPWPHRNDGRFQ